ncbi:DNA repair protein [Niveomyces insectorum RCEF 264]|uniref:Postreplication repair E3 ubiquitin-protein ligase RAD18 n=1 Tax=Niveomyces insectorum RCEF 264 TaxID=1081102 RepID=A0A162LBQ4_9HYPO|nr:DNA repair protein [Niveomyces insectorum RCEF 264]
MDFRDGAADVADSTDWLGTALACLMPVEQAFRCHVCKDFYNSPMITSCNHTFCSLCIRRCLSVDGKCPLCRMTDQESKLRGNWALREAIGAFCIARPTVLAVARKPPSAAREASPPKRKAGDDDDATTTQRAHSDGQDHEPQAKRTRTSARLSKAKAAEAAPPARTTEEPEVVFVEASSPPGGDDGDMDYEPDDGLAACPICWTRMKPWQVDRHIDTSCTGSPRKPKKTTTTTTFSATASATTSKWPRFGDAANPFTTASTPAPPPERLPSLSYSLLTDAALRKKLASLGLSTTGPRPLLERRHKEWTTLWNANCDSARPKRKADLLHDLDIWERTIGAGVGVGVGGGTGSNGSGGRGSVLASRSIATANQQAAQIKDKDFDGAAWVAKHNTSFQDLIANARKSRAKAEEAGKRREHEGQTGETQKQQEQEQQQQPQQPLARPEGNDPIPEPLRPTPSPTTALPNASIPKLPPETTTSGNLVAPTREKDDTAEDGQHRRQLETEAAAAAVQLEASNS